MQKCSNTLIVPTTHDTHDNYSAWSLDELTELAISYCHRLEVWGLDSSSRQEFDRILAELDGRGKL
jgi:hypothetical protein